MAQNKGAIVRYRAIENACAPSTVDTGGDYTEVDGHIFRN